MYQGNNLDYSKDKRPIIGEAAKHISEEYKQNFSDIPWRQIIAMRNYLVHEYFAIHNDKIMAALTDIPRIKQRIQEIIRVIENAKNI